jgi:tetratricopeptide (TPR) repeat protein
MGSSSSFQRRSFISLLFFLPAVAYASAPQRPTCVRSAAIETKLHAHPSATVYAESGAWFKAGNKFECAARDYREAAKLDPRSAAFLLGLGESLASANDLPGAETALRQAVKREPENIQGHESLALVLEQAGKKDDAKGEWAAALKLNPNSVSALDGMSKHLMLEGNYPAAIELLRSAPDNEALTINLAHAYAQGGSLQDAETLLRKAVTENPGSFPLTRALVGVLVDEHLFERTFQEPTELAEGYANTHPDNLEAQRLYLQMLIAWIPQGAQSGDVARATPVAKQLLAAHPNDPYFLYANGMLERQGGDYKVAKEHLERSIALDPGADHAHYQLGMALSALGDAPGAKREFEKTLALCNKEPEVRFQLAKVLRTLGQSEEAKTQLKLYSDQMAAASQQRVAKLKEGQGDKAMESGNASDAVIYFRQAIEANPDSAMLQFKLAMAMDKTADAAGERTALEKAIQIDPTMAVAQNQLGYLASRSGDAASAEQYFRRAVQAAPQYAEAWVNLAATLGMESKIPEAQEAIASALKADPKNAAALQLQQELNSQQH